MSSARELPDEATIAQAVGGVLREPASGVDFAEALWVTRRLAELLEWGDLALDP